MRYVSLFTGLLLLTCHLTSHAAENGQVFNDWKTQCTDKQADHTARCHIFQNLVAKDGKTRVLHIAIGYVKDRTDPAAIITLPLGLSLTQGVAVRTDDSAASKFPFQACFNSGCQAGFPMTSQLMGQFKRGNKAYVTVYDLSNQPVDIPVSLNGFSAAVKAIRPGG